MAETMTLQEKLTGYETIFEELENKIRREVGVVRSETLDNNGKKQVRVLIGGNDVVLMVSSMCKPLQINDEVIIMGNVVTEKVNKVLVAQRKVESYKLVKWDEIGGMSTQIEEIQSIVDVTIAQNKLAKEFGVQPIKGLLLYGPPGCGKTLIVKAIARHVLNKDTAERGEFTYVKGAELLDKYVGESEHRVINIFKEAREFEKKSNRKSILFIDEAEAILASRGTRLLSSTIVPTFLSEMDGLHDHTPFIILSTNRPSDIDEAILRDGRIDIKIKIERPDYAAAVEIFKVHLGKVKCKDDIETLALAGAKLIFDQSPTMKQIISGAMIANMVNIAAKDAMFRLMKKSDDPRGVVIHDLTTAINKLS